MKLVIPCNKQRLKKNQFYL